MSKSHRYVGAAVAVAAVLFTPDAWAAKPKLNPALVGEGKIAYQNRCADCHGPTGRGDGASCERLQARPRNFALETFDKGRKPAEVFETVTAGSGDAMPAFTDLSEQERWAVSYYVLILRASGRNERAATAAARSE